MKKRLLSITSKWHKKLISLALLNGDIKVKILFLVYKGTIKAFLKITLRVWVNLLSK